MWNPALITQWESQMMTVSTPNALARRPISRCPSIAACRLPFTGPSCSDISIVGTCVHFAARTILPISSSLLGRDRPSGSKPLNFVLAQSEGRVLGLHVKLEGPLRAVTANARCLHSAERRRQMAHVFRVHPDHPRLKRA